MSAHGRAGSKRRGNAASRRSGTNGRPAAPPTEAAPDAAPETVATATATVNPPAPVAENPSRVALPRRSARPPVPEAAKPSRPPMPEKPKTIAESRVPGAERAAGLQKWYQDTKAEMQKIVWPDRETTKNLTIVVIGISVVLGLLLGGIDYLLQAVFEALP
jgi:preprotein translocase subunit SecE